MKIGFIGAGRVGFSLAKWLNVKRNITSKIYSKKIEDSIELAKFSIGEYCDNINELICSCDTLFLTVNDDSLIDIVNKLIELNVSNKILIHTSGAMSSDIFNILNDNNYCYSLHPLSAFNDKYNSYKNLDNIYFTLEGNDKYLDDIKKIFNNVKIIKKEDKIKYHLASSIASNMVCSVINIAEEIYKEIGIDDINIYKPLIENNISNIINYGSNKALTGPIIRNDYNTVLKHINNLSGNDLMVYKYLGLNLIKMSKEMTSLDYSKIEKLLEEI